MGNKRDIKQFKQACREAAVRGRQRHWASDDFHAAKRRGELSQHIRYGELVASAARLEAELMLTTMDQNRALIEVLANFRGLIVDARIAYPDVLHLDVRDGQGELWQFATQDASWFPSDPTELRDKSILGADVDWATRRLRCELSEGATFTVIPAPQEEADDPPNWELFTPSGLMLEFGPGPHCQVVNERDL